MKNLLALSLCLLTVPAFGQSKVLTIVAKGYTSVTNNGQVSTRPTVATFAVPAGEAVKIVTVCPTPTPAEGGHFSVIKEGVLVYPGVGDVVAGPATVTLWFNDPQFRQDTDGAILTLERWKVAKVLPVR